MLSTGLRISGISLLLAISPALAQVSGAPAASSDTAVIAPRQHAPRHVYHGGNPRVIDNVTVEDSTNWSGYAVDRFFVYEGEGLVDCSHRQLHQDPQHLCGILGGH